MYCTHCGKQIEDNSKFCPYCGGTLSTSDIGSAKEALKKTAGAVMDSAKAIGNSVNEATGGQAGKYAEKAKETAKGFTDDVKQVAKDKDTSNFFTKNKYRNVKIIAVVLIAIFFLSGVFGGGSSDFREDMAKQLAVAEVKDSLNEPDTAKFSNITIIDQFKTDGGDVYIVSMTFEAKDGLGQSQKMNCALIVGLTDNVTESNYKKGNISKTDTSFSPIFPYADDEKEESIKKLKEAASDFK